jgi:hypothetical protein
MELPPQRFFHTAPDKRKREKEGERERERERKREKEREEEEKKRRKKRVSVIKREVLQHGPAGWRSTPLSGPFIYAQLPTIATM